MRTSSRDGSPTTSAASRSRIASQTSATRVLGHEHAADRRALLAGLLRHVAHDVGEEQLAGLARQLDVGPEHRRVELVGLDVEPHAVLDDLGVRAQRPRRRRCRR